MLTALGLPSVVRPVRGAVPLESALRASSRAWCLLPRSDGGVHPSPDSGAWTVLTPNVPSSHNYFDTFKWPKSGCCLWEKIYLPAFSSPSGPGAVVPAGAVRATPSSSVGVTGAPGLTQALMEGALGASRAFRPSSEGLQLSGPPFQAFLGHWLCLRILHLSKDTRGCCVTHFEGREKCFPLRSQYT